MLAASSSGSAPRAIVPEIGQVSTRSPLTRTYISGDAPTRYSPSPEVEEELVRRRVALPQPLVEARTGDAHGAWKTWPGTTSNRSPRANRSLACSTTRRVAAGLRAAAGARPARHRSARRRRARPASAGAGRAVEAPATVELVAVPDRRLALRSTTQISSGRCSTRSRWPPGRSMAQPRPARTGTPGRSRTRRTAPGAGPRTPKAAVTSRSAENTVGRRDRSSSVNVPRRSGT